MNNLTKAGYSDIVAVNPLEKIYVILMNIFGLLILCHLFSEAFLINNMFFENKKKILQ